MRDIALRFANSEDALHRHLSKHLKPAIARTKNVEIKPMESARPTLTNDPQTIAETADGIAEEARSNRQGGSELLARVNFLWQESLEGLADSRKPAKLRRKDGTEVELAGGDLKARAAFIGQARKVAELGGLATGELKRAADGPAGATITVVFPGAGIGPADIAAALPAAGSQVKRLAESGGQVIDVTLAGSDGQ